MSELTDMFNEASAARFKDLAPAVEVPARTSFEYQMDHAQEHHECPEKRVKGRCRCVLND